MVQRLQRFSQGGLFRCRALEAVAGDMLALAPAAAGPAGAPGGASARSGAATFFRLADEGPTVRGGDAFAADGPVPADGAAGGAPREASGGAGGAPPSDRAARLTALGGGAASAERPGAAPAAPAAGDGAAGSVRAVRGSLEEATTPAAAPAAGPPAAPAAASGDAAACQAGCGDAGGAHAGSLRVPAAAEAFPEIQPTTPDASAGRSGAGGPDAVGAAGRAGGARRAGAGAGAAEAPPAAAEADAPGPAAGAAADADQGWAEPRNGAGAAAGDGCVELPVVTPFSHRLQALIKRVSAAPVRPRRPSCPRPAALGGHVRSCCAVHACVRKALR